MRDVRATIRPASINDAGPIHKLELLCSKNPWSLESLVDRIDDPKSIFLVLTIETRRSRVGVIVGFACSSLILDELQIYEVAVHPVYRGKGLGSTLINDLLATAAENGAARASLEVRVSNYSAIRLYEKFGFKRDGVRKGYYQDGEDAALMSARLAPR